MCAVWLVDAPTWMMGAWCEEWSATLIVDRPITMAEPERAHNVDTRAGVKGRQACEPSLIIAVIMNILAMNVITEIESFQRTHLLLYWLY